MFAITLVFALPRLLACAGCGNITVFTGRDGKVLVDAVIF